MALSAMTLKSVSVEWIWPILTMILMFFLTSFFFFVLKDDSSNDDLVNYTIITLPFQLRNVQALVFDHYQACLVQFM